MKRYDCSLADFPEHARLQLQPVISERERGLAPRVVAGQLSGAPERLFAIRGALLDQEAAPPGRHATLTRH